MIAVTVSLMLTVIVGMIIKAHALSIVKHLISSWVKFYSVFAPEEDRIGRQDEVLSHLYEFTNTFQKEGYAPEAIAFLIFENLIRGILSDIVWCIPFVPYALAIRTKRWGNNLRHYRIPTVMIAGVAILGMLNYSLFSSDNPTLTNWLIANGIAVIMTILLWKIKHPLVKRIYYSWMSTIVLAAGAIMVWMCIEYHIYEIVTFKIFILALVALFPLVIVIDKSWRSCIFKNKWWLIPICWVPFISIAIVGSLFITQSIMPLFEMLSTMLLLAVVMLTGYGIILLVSYILCWLGIRGSSGGLRLLASGIRRLN